MAPSVFSISNIGIITGGSLSKMSHDNLTKDDVGEYRSSFKSIYISSEITSLVSLQLEITLRKHGSSFTHVSNLYRGTVTIEENVELDYLEVPILFKFPYKFSKKVQTNFSIGPLFSYLLNGTSHGEFTTTPGTLHNGVFYFDNEVENANKEQFGMIYGAELLYLTGKYKFIVSIRYASYFSQVFYSNSSEKIIQNLSPIIHYNSKFDYQSFKNNAISIGLGINVGL